jgi:hypothetical protein
MTGFFQLENSGIIVTRYMDHVKEMDRLLLNHICIQEDILYPMVMSFSQGIR